MPPTTLPMKLVEVLSEEDKYVQHQIQLEKELSSLRQEYNILDKDRLRAQQHGSSKMAKTTKIFNVFKSEHENIRTDLTVAASSSKKREDAKMFDYLNNLVMEYGFYKATVSNEKIFMSELEEQIKVAKRSVVALRKEIITDAQQVERAKIATKTRELLENNLETQIKKFNLVCTKNRKSREEIDHLLWDRRNFMVMWKTIIEKLSFGKKILLDLIEQATIAYDQREDLCNRLQALRIKGHSDLMANIQDMRELKRKHHHLKKLEDFFNTKGQKRLMKDLDSKQKLKRLELKQKLREKLDYYRSMLNDILAFTKESELKVIAQRYCNQEEENFMHFKFINDVMEEMESVSDSLNNLREEIEEQRILQSNLAQNQQNRLKALEKALNKALKETQEAEAELKALNGTISNMMEGVWLMFKTCRCDNDPLLCLLGDNTTIKPYNLMFHLNILEKKIHECMINVGYRDKIQVDKRRIRHNQKVISTDEKIRTDIYSIDKILQANPCVLCVEHEMVTDVIDSLQHVWTRKDVIEKLKSHLEQVDTMYMKKTLTDDEKYMQNQRQLERELTRLRKEFAVLDLDRSRGQYATGSSLLKTKKVIALFTKEHENILNDLCRARNPGRKREDAKIFDNLSHLVDEYNDVDGNVREYKVYIKEIKGEIKNVKKSVHHWQKQQFTDRQYEERVWAAIKTIEALENKLETQMIKFGTICNKNKESRMQIDHLLWERRIFLKQWNKLIDKLTEGKQIMLDLIEQATIAYNQREECCNKLQILRLRAVQDLNTNKQEMNEYKGKQDHFLKLKEFFMVKGQKRIMKDVEMKVREKRIKRRQNLEEKVERYKNMFQDIQTFSKETNIQNIARNFNVEYEANLSKFKYIIEMIREMEVVGDDLARLQLEISEKRILHDNREKQQQNTLEDLEVTLEDTKADAEGARQDLEAVEGTYNNLLQGVATLFKICKCDKDPLLRLLGDNTEVRFYNVNFYLELLESKVQNLLIGAGYKDKILGEKKKDAPYNPIVTVEETKPKIYPIEKIIATTPCSLLEIDFYILTCSFIKTTKVVSLFAKEHENILNNLSRATDPGRKKEDAKLFDKLNQTVDDYSDTQTSVRQYKVHIKEIDEEIRQAKKSVQQLRKRQITDRQFEDRVWEAMKTVEALENKLETQMIKFGTICAKNRRLRLEIDHHLCERKTFLAQWDKFIHKLTEGKQVMLDLIEQATIAFNQREEWCNKLQILRIKSHQDLVVNMQAMREYKRRCDNSFKLEEFFLIKGRKRVMRDLKFQVAEKMKKRQQQLEEKLDYYKTMLTDIQQFTRETKIEDIARKYVTQEELNMSNFKYVIDSIKDMEMIGDNLGVLHLDIEERSILHQNRAKQQKTALRRLETDLEDFKADAQAAENCLKSVDKKFDAMLKGVEKLFTLCRCDKDPILKLLGDHTTVCDYNVSLYLDVLEVTIQRLLITACWDDKISSEKRKHAHEKKIFTAGERNPRIYSIDKIVKITPCSLCVEHDMVTDVIDVLQPVLTRLQACKKLQFRLQQPGGLAPVHNISHSVMPPNKKAPPLTDDEKLKVQLQAEQELVRLQRQYVYLERDRQKYSCGVKLLRLNKVLAITRKEHNNILTDLKVADASARRKENGKIHDHLSSLLNESDSYAYKVAKEKQYMQETDDQIKMVEKEVVKLRSQDITDRRHEERVWAATKTIEALENKLEVQLTKFGCIYGELQIMRKTISGLLWERDVFMKIWKKMINKLTLGKRFMLDLIGQATVAYDQREEWCSKLQTLRIKAHQDFVHHCQEVRELKRRQDDNRKLEEFFSIKGRKRVMRDMERKEAVRRMEQKEKLNARMTNFKQLMEEILEFTQEPRVQVIAKKYYNREAENFMRFTYVNNLIEEMETMTHKLGNLYLDIEEQRAIVDMKNEHQKKKIQDLEMRLQQVQRTYEASEEQVKMKDKNLEKMFEGIDSIFKICRCQNDPILELLGDNKTVNIYNAMLYLELIEKKVHRAMLEVYYRNKILYEKKKITLNQRIIGEEKTKPVIYSLEKIVTSNPCALCFENEMVGDAIDSLQRVLTRSEAKKRLKTLPNSGNLSLRIHNVSNCNLPKSREIVQKRYS
ncbi:hypothetical protein BDFB_002579 [Asbolus verrucosus]|uniref:ODAD1 central coiled coil region domain-containing protein n=1 Tax=Asbolus verrucosus TaxID=1661398 RepID=A0A482W7Z9_ASBVE|nr:hypothetical protein BDFB_002579 [Asbolus verrucosus]